MPTRKDKTNVAPIYREQVFIPASGATLVKQKSKPKVSGRPVSSGAVEIVSPEFDLLTGLRGIYNITSAPINITSKNAIKITDKQWDKAYIKAVKNNDLNEAQRLRDLHFQAKSPDNIVIKDGMPIHNYHGTDTDFNVFDLSYFGKTDAGDRGRGFYFSSNKDIAENYGGIIKDVYLYGKTPYNGTRASLLNRGRNKAEIITQYNRNFDKNINNDVKLLLEQQKSGDVSPLYNYLSIDKNTTPEQIKNKVIDYYSKRRDKFVKELGNVDEADIYLSDYENVIYDANKIKSAKAIIYDENGELINLSKRDNFNINDIRMKCGGRRKAQLGLDIREGGIAIPIANNMFYIDGRKHAAGGVAIGPNNKNGVEVEGGEVVEMIDSNHPSVGRQFKAGGQQQTMRVFSSVPFLRGASPAELVLGGANPDIVFKAQEEFKDRNRINDDGTRYEVGGEKIYTPSKSIQRQIQETGNITIGGAPTIGGLRTFGYLRGLTTARKYGAKGSLIFRAGKELIKRGTQKLVDNGKITKEVAQIPRSIYGQFIGAYGQNLPKTIGLINNMEQKRFGGSKQDDTKTAALKHLRNKFTIHGNYNGGMFGGAGAGSVIMEQPEFITDTITKRYLVPVTQNFNDAFGDAVNAGLNKFMFDNKWYNTKKGNNPNNNSAGAARTQTVIIPIEHKEVRRRKKEFGGSMIYTINGNVKNGLSHRPKAKYGKIDKKDKDTKVGQDGLIYKRAADGEWYTDGTKHITYKPISKNSRKDLYYANPVQGLYHDVHNDGSFANVSSLVPDEYETITRKFDKPKRTHVSGYAFEDEEKEAKKIGSLTYEKNEDGQWVPASKQSTTTTRDGGRPKDFGMTRTGVNHPNGSYKYHPLTGEKISEMGVVETSEPNVKGTTKIASKSSSTARGRGTKAYTPKAAARTTTKGADVKYGTPLKEKKESLYMTGIKNNSITPLRAGMEKIKSPYSTGGGTQSKDGRWIGQYKTTNIGDWIGLGSNLTGSVASYFMTKNIINKMPEPLKPIMAQAAKLKTRYNVNSQLSEIREAEQMNRASVRRNTQSSNTSLAREQRLMNEARGARNTLYGQKENIETQLINQDRLNRQSVMRDNVRAYNEYLNKVTATKMAQNEMRASNINNLISGLTGSVNSILGNIESRRATNNTLRAIAAANPNVDARLIGGFDYYIDPITKKKYNKNQQYVGTING